MDIKDIQSQAAERIWLFPGEHEGETTLLWGDDPAPGQGMDPAEAVEYVRKDVADARIAELERERDAYRTAEEHQIALRQKMEQERDSLAALFVRLQDGATDLIHASSEEEAGDAMELIAECSEKEARSILARVIAESRIEGALAVRHLTQGDDWEDTELRAVIDDYVAGLSRQTEAQQ